MKKADFYQQITNSFIEKLEQGVKPWATPWVKSPITGGMPANAKTGQAYNGMNILCLWASAEHNQFASRFWLTFKQTLDMGGHVRKDEKGTRVMFYQVREVTTSDGEAEEIPVMRHFTAFNLDQVDGIDDPDCGCSQGGGFDPVERVEHLITATGATVIEAGERAYYDPSPDTVHMPDRLRFDNAADHAATIIHELCHWAGNKRRLNYDMGRLKGRAAYAYEELVCELGAAFVMADMGIQGDVQHESYLASWLQALKGDKRYLFRAAAQASKAHKYLMDFITDDESQQQEAA